MEMYLANDHAIDKNRKSQLIKKIESLGVKIIDLGCDGTESVDYPDYGKALATEVVKNNKLGIVICGTGIGISIAANKVKGARAALCHCEEYAELARQHNNANILALGARFLTDDQIVKIVKKFIETKFEEGRHLTRINKIEI